jgi:hypothetical protein
MFGFFKKKNTSRDTVLEIAIYARNFDAKLKHVENLKKIGRAEDADLEMSKICDEAIPLFLHRYAVSDEVKQVQYLSLVELLKFLNTQGYNNLFAKTSNEISRQLSRFNATELGMLSHIMGLKVESAKKEKTDVRLVFYTCQECGNLNLVVTEPCIKCGFIPRTEKELRRSLLLNSKFIYPKYLLEISRRVSIAYHSNPRGSSLSQIWGSDDIDHIAYQKTEKINSQVTEMLDKCVSKLHEQRIDYSIKYNCHSCHEANGVWADRHIQICRKCNSENNVPAFKLYKSALIDSLDYIRMSCVVGDDIKIANLIAEMTLHYDYSVRRNQYPTLSQREDLRQRFELVGTISYINSLELNFSSSTFTWTPKKDSDEELVEQFKYHVDSLRTLFKIMEMDVSL